MQPFKSTSLIEFTEKFQTNDDCYQYLVDLKWGKGFRCSRCKCKTVMRSKTWYYRRCKECLYDESATSGTLFHKLKFPLIKAFHILFRISISKKGISSVQIAKEYGIRQRTAWFFRRKVQIAMKGSGHTILTGKVNVDEFTVGGPEKGMQGRSDSSKNKGIIAIELRGRKKKRKIGLAYAQCIEDYKTESFRPFFKNIINRNAKIETDAFPSYAPLSKEYHLTQYLSDNGKSFPEIHLIIMDFKSWLRGIHHKCQYRYLQNYLDEFIFRFNRRNSEKGIFNTIVNRFMEESPWPWKWLYELND